MCHTMRESLVHQFVGYEMLYVTTAIKTYYTKHKNVGQHRCFTVYTEYEDFSSSVNENSAVSSIKGFYFRRSVIIAAVLPILKV